MKVFGGIQQLGIGVADAPAAFEWYARHLGFDVPLFDDEGTAALMLPYTGGEARDRRAILALNLRGGSGLEIWQYRGREPLPPAGPPLLGDLGILAARLRAPDLEGARSALTGAGSIASDPGGARHFEIRDPWGNALEIVEGAAAFSAKGTATAGVSGALVGVSDIGASLPFWSGVLGYDLAVYDRSGTFDDLRAFPGGEERYRRVLLARSAPPKGPFSPLVGTSEIELVQALDRRPRRLFEGRFWGDLGFIHLCFDVGGMDEWRRDCAAAGRPFTVDSAAGGASFDMGKAAGRFAYVEDPDGTLVELVETHRIPIAAKFGLSIDLRRRDPEKPLPRAMIRLLGLARRRFPRADEVEPVRSS